MSQRGPFPLVPVWAFLCKLEVTPKGSGPRVGRQSLLGGTRTGSVQPASGVGVIWSLTYARAFELQGTETCLLQVPCRSQPEYRKCRKWFLIQTAVSGGGQAGSRVEIRSSPGPAAV